MKSKLQQQITDELKTFRNDGRDRLITKGSNSRNGAVVVVVAVVVDGTPEVLFARETQGVPLSVESIRNNKTEI